MRLSITADVGGGSSEADNPLTPLFGFSLARALLEVYTNSKNKGARRIFINPLPLEGLIRMVTHMKYTRFEKARIIGARALQISYGAPVLVDYPESMLDPIDIAMLEYDNDLIPISVVRN